MDLPPPPNKSNFKNASVSTFKNGSRHMWNMVKRFGRAVMILYYIIMMMAQQKRFKLMSRSFVFKIIIFILRCECLQKLYLIPNFSIYLFDQFFFAYIWNGECYFKNSLKSVIEILYNSQYNWKLSRFFHRLAYFFWYIILLQKTFLGRN